MNTDPTPDTDHVAEVSPINAEVALRRELLRLVENYELEVSTVLAPRNPETLDPRSYRVGHAAGARAALARTVNDLKEALA